MFVCLFLKGFHRVCPPWLWPSQPARAHWRSRVSWWLLVCCWKDKFRDSHRRVINSFIRWSCLWVMLNIRMKREAQTIFTWSCRPRQPFALLESYLLAQRKIPINPPSSLPPILPPCRPRSAVLWRQGCPLLWRRSEITKVRQRNRRPQHLSGQLVIEPFFDLKQTNQQLAPWTFFSLLVRSGFCVVYSFKFCLFFPSCCLFYGW